ncbi:hypothetical protein OKW38_002257 [Paraburkholderia sp. MM5496-R1]|uniref:hypothetical protein n=1 Tax=Paraburkholderia sp. MM5496-R1 TaxID=2991065 RepID=UPI003D1B7F2E
MNVISFARYLERRRQSGGGVTQQLPSQPDSLSDLSAVPPFIASQPQQSQSDRPCPGSFFLWDDGLGNREVEFNGRWDADESDLDYVLLQLLLKLRKGGLRRE